MVLFTTIKKWLKKTLGMDLGNVVSGFIEMSKDGTILAQVLQSYGIIEHKDLQLLQETSDPLVAYENYANHIKKWLNRLDLDLTEPEIHDITHGDGTAALTIFYETYTRLECPTKISKPDTIKFKSHQFIVQKVSEYGTDEEFKFSSNPLCEPLLKRWDLINWERDHLQALLMKYSKSRDEYQEYLETKRSVTHNILRDFTEMDPVFLKTEETHYSYSELMEQQKKALEMEQFVPNPEEAKKIMKKIKRRNKERAEKAAFCVKSQQEAVSKALKKFEESEEIEFEKLVCEKLMKQSQYEKEVAEKLFSIRSHKETIIQNRKRQDEMEQKKKDEAFVRALFEEDLEQRLKYHDERTALIKEHKRLYAEKMKLKALKHQKIAAEAVCDIVDIALKTAEYKETYGIEPNQYIKQNWATLFVHQQPIFDLVPTLSVTIKTDHHEDIPEEIYQREMVRQDVLDNQDLDDYIHFKPFWIIEEDLESVTALMDLGMNVLGYIVHQLLLKKYPLPIPQRPNLSQEVAACVGNIADLSRLNYLQKLLEIKGIKVVQMQDAVDYCVKAFEEEYKTEFDEPFPDDEDLKELTPRKNAKKEKKGKGGKKEKKGKGGKKDEESKGGKKEKKGKGGKKDKGSKKGSDKGKHKDEEPIHSEDKQAQTPRLFPWEKIILSNKAKLGKVAKTEMDLGHLLDDKIQVDMLIEYLLSLPDIKGWVLINYPNTYEEAVVLEQALTGKPVPKEYTNLNKESLESLDIESEEVSSTLESVTKDEQKLCDIEYSETLQDEGSSIKSKESSHKKDKKEVAKEKISKLLPDLKDLAYSSDDGDLDFAKLRSPEKCPCTKKTEAVDALVAEEVAPTKETSAKAVDNVDDRINTKISFNLLDKQIESEGRAETNRVSTPPEQKMSTGHHPEEEIKHDTTKDCVCLVAEEPELEFKFKAEELPEEEVDDEPQQNPVADDIFEDKRLSKILPNPRPLEKELYSTVLTAFIKVVPKEDELEEDYKVPFFKEIERKDPLVKFYCDQGCFYLLEYEDFNGETVKCLAKMIIGDYSLPLKSSVEIFGERYKEAVFEVGDVKITKKGKEKKKDKKKGKKKVTEKVSVKTKKDKKGKKDKKSKKSGSSKGKKDKKKKGEKKVDEIAHEDKEVQVPIEEQAEEEEFREPRAGEPDWVYVNLPIPPEIEESLATLWENTEDNYITNLKEKFFKGRVIINDVVPFLVKTKHFMTEFIARPDPKQTYLHQFQKTLNQIDLNLRNDRETKAELLCRIEEFEEKLLGICDTKMRENEDQRRHIIQTNYLFGQFCELVNNYVRLFQIEVDRFVDTLQLLSDYYIAVVTKSVEQGYQFEKEILPKYDSSEEDSEKFNQIFLNADCEDFNTVFHNYIREISQMTLVYVESMKPLSLHPVNDMKKLFVAEAKPKKKPWKKNKTDTKKFEPDQDVQDNIDRILEEWDCALNGEFTRMIVVLNVLKHESSRRFDEIIQWIRKEFVEIYDSISTRYEKELSSVHKACELLTQSVEDEVIIQPELTFEDDQLAMIQVMLFPHNSVPPAENGCFRMEQLKFMVQVLLDLAKNGYIMKQSFLLLIQDILYQDEEEVPKLWRNLSTTTLNALFQKIFQDEEYFYWKDFIVCSLMIPFPTREQLMDVRTQFVNFDEDRSETVIREDFDQVVFWFEDLDNAVKSLLFQMYQTDDDIFNYTAMLMDFCKDDDPILGFVKALELALGKFICYEWDKGEEFVNEVLEDRMLFEQRKKEHEECLLLAQQYISRLVDKIVAEDDDIESLTITELLDQKPSIASNKIMNLENPDGKILIDNTFSHSKIGYEARDNTDWAFFLPLELVLIVVKSAIGWSLKSDDEKEEGESFTDKVVNIYEKCRNEKFNDVVLAHQFLNCQELKELFKEVTKFSAHNPVKLIKQILPEEKVEENESGDNL